MNSLQQVYAKELINAGARLNYFFDQLQTEADLINSETLHGLKIEYVRELAIDAVTAQYLKQIEEA